MKKFIKPALLCLLLTLVSCGQSTLSITNNYTEGFYVMDAKTARAINAGDIKKQTDEGKMLYLTVGGSQFNYGSTNKGSTAFDKYKAGDNYIFCFVSDSALEYAKANKSKPEYVAIPADSKMEYLTEINIVINNKGGLPEFEFKTKQETGF